MKVYVHYEEGSDAEQHVTLKLTLPKRWNDESPVKLLKVRRQTTRHVRLTRVWCGGNHAIRLMRRKEPRDDTWRAKRILPVSIWGLSSAFEKIWSLVDTLTFTAV